MLFHRRFGWQCWFCKHYQSSSPERNGRPVCKAFPDGIPSQIIYNQFDHRESFPEDNGIRFEMLPTEELSSRSVFAKLTPEELEREIRKILNLLDSVNPHIDYTSED